MDSILAIVLCECRSGPSGFLNKSGLLTEHEELSELQPPEQDLSAAASAFLED